MKARHASEVAAQKMVWRQLAAEREKVWSDYRQEFATPELQQDKQQSPRDEFRDAASGTTQAGAKPADQNLRETESITHLPSKNHPGGTGAPDGRLRNGKPMELTKNETEAMMTVAAAGSAIGTSRIDLRQCLKTQNAVSLDLARFAK